jgi:hypothetical protein
MKIGNKEIEFFDGETINDKYILLSNSQDYIINKKGLTPEQSLDFLFDYSKNVNFFFRISYDINMIFSKEKLTSELTNLFNAETVLFYGYEITYFEDKILIIKKGKTTKKFFDISNFFKKSFLKTLEILKVPVSQKDLDFLNRYKNLRSEFDLKDLANIVSYNKLECNLGLEIVKAVYDLIPPELQTTSLYGASSITNKFLRLKEIHKKNNFFNFYDKEKFLLTYYGGRMESLKIGTFHNCYKYDINSAYPNVIKDLKEIENITEKKYFNQKIKPENIYFIELKINDIKMIGLLPVRLKSGYIVFPNYVKGWYYGSEIEIIKQYEKKYLIELKIYRCLEITLGEKIFSNKEIENLYFKRNIFKQKDDLRNYIYKILLNSIYGKFAQQIGSCQFQNLYYAGFITSVTRSELLKAVIKNPYDIIFFATDGILSETKINVPISSQLGDWEEIKIKESKVLLSGVYKCIDNKNKIYLGERGFNFNFDNVFNDVLKTGKSKIEQNIFIGNKYYFKNLKAFNNYRCKFKKIIKTISPLTQIKRTYLGTINLNYSNNSLIFSQDIINKINGVMLENHFKNSEFLDD